MASSATKTKKSTAIARREPAAPVAPKGSWENPLIPNAKLQQVYTAMLRAQMLEAKLASAAQRAPEAVAAGLLTDLRNEDVLVSAAPSYHFLKGVPLKQLFAKKKPKDLDHGFPAQNILPTIADSAAALNTAVGLAFSFKLNSTGDRNSDLVLAFADDAAACIQAVRLAELHRLPILFVYMQKTAKAALTLQTRRYGVPGMPVDRDDALAVYRVAQEGIARARSGGGPTLIECMRYQVPQQRKPNAITTMEKYLNSKGLFTSKWKSTLLAGFRRELVQAAKTTRKAK